MVIEKTKEGPL